MFTEDTRSYNMITHASDIDGGILQIQASFTKNGGTTSNVPSGIFTLSSGALNVNPTSLYDKGVYKITYWVIDELSTPSIKKTFTLTIKYNGPYLIATDPPNTSIKHFEAKTYALASYFTEDNGDPLTMSATYSFNGGPATNIPSGIFAQPSGIFAQPSDFEIIVTSTSIMDVGTYVFTLTVKDLELK